MSLESQNHGPSVGELTHWIETSGESEFVDAKGPMTWDGADESASLAKDIVSFANSRDGGVIVVGKAQATDGSFLYEGLTPEQAASFDTTKVGQWVNAHFSPPICLTCHQAEYNSRKFVVIIVQEFNDIPSLCIKGLSQNPGLFQGDVGELQMDEGQVVADFLFPPDKQAPRTVGPGMATFDHPATSTLPSTTLCLDFALARNVGNIAEAFRERFRGSAAIALVQTEMLLGSSGRLGARHGDRLQCGTQQFGVVNVGAGERDAQRHTAAVRYDGALDAKFTPIGGVLTGFFPHLTAPWSWSRPMPASANRYRGGRHTFEDISSRSDGRCGGRSIPGSIDAPYLVNRTAAAKPSTGSLFATDRRSRWQRPADSREAARPSDCADTWAATAPTAATFSPASAQTDQTNRDAYPPP